MGHGQGGGGGAGIGRGGHQQSLGLGLDEAHLLGKPVVGMALKLSKFYDRLAVAIFRVHVWPGAWLPGGHALVGVLRPA